MFRLALAVCVCFLLALTAEGFRAGPSAKALKQQATGRSTLFQHFMSKAAEEKKAEKERRKNLQGGPGDGKPADGKDKPKPKK
jgi:hypothetical protein